MYLSPVFRMCSLSFRCKCQRGKSCHRKHIAGGFYEFDESSDAAQMKIISSANGIIASSILGNEKGCYEVFDRPANGGNLLYTDYATKSHIYLSNQINSDHNNESDTSYLESTIGGCYLALSDDYLFIFKLNTPSFAADETSERQGYIARCDLDGADRQILTKLTAKIFTIFLVCFKTMAQLPQAH